MIITDMDRLYSWYLNLHKRVLALMGDHTCKSTCGHMWFSKHFQDRDIHYSISFGGYCFNQLSRVEVVTGKSIEEVASKLHKILKQQEDLLFHLEQLPLKEADHA